MSSRHRPTTMAVFWVGAAGFAALFALAAWGLPSVGDVAHPYAERAVPTAVQHDTANVIGSVTFDQRGLDTLGEEFILLAAAVGTILLLRRLSGEDEESGVEHEFRQRDVFDAVRLAGVALLPVTLLVGAYIVLHGTVSPGGGFQGGVVLATGVHLAYLGGDYHVLERLRPVLVFDVGEAIGAAGYVIVGAVGVVVTGSFLANVLPTGTMGDVNSGGTVFVLNVAVGFEVGSALVLLIARFLDQGLLIRAGGSTGQRS
ncbi:MAG TPA: MnhB domain-containing protein [Nocardioidaceae bacterium]